MERSGDKRAETANQLCRKGAIRSKMWSLEALPGGCREYMFPGDAVTTIGGTMKESGEVNIRNFQNDDLKQVADIMVSGFKDKFRSLTSLPPNEMLGLLMDTGMIYPYPYPGYIVAEDNSGILGVMMLKWRGQERPKFKLEFIKTARKYGWLRLTRLLFGSTILEPSPKKGECLVDRVAVRTDTRGRGIGTGLLKHGKELAAQNGLKEVTLYVVSTNERAVKLYEKLGFKILKTQKSLLTEWILGSREWHYMSCGTGGNL